MKTSIVPTITIKPDVRFGKPTISGTRVTVEDILYLLESGYSVQDIPKQIPSVKLSAVKNILS